MPTWAIWTIILLVAFIGYVMEAIRRDVRLIASEFERKSDERDEEELEQELSEIGR